MTAALVMAGGRSQRMRESAGRCHKALKPVLGVPLIERNLCQLFGAGVQRIVVATNARETEIVDYVSTRGQRLARAVDAEIECLQETSPLGTIGAAGYLADFESHILVVNVDNLTALNLRRLVDHHIAQKAAMTVAVHDEHFPMSFGQVVVDDGEIVDYLEKPRVPFKISSGTYVLSPTACRKIDFGQRTDAPDLLMSLRDRGETVSAFEHNAPWIDINDADALDRATCLIRDHSAAFDCWAKHVTNRRVDMLITENGSIMAERVASTKNNCVEDYDVPNRWMKADRHDQVELAQQLACERRGEPSSVEPLVSYDEIDESSGEVVRHHVFHAVLKQHGEKPEPATDPDWIPLAEIEGKRSVSSAMSRGLAILRS